MLYEPQAGSVPAQVVGFLRHNPDEHLTLEDITVKFNVGTANIHTLLARALEADLLKRSKNTDSDWVYSAGPALRPVKDKDMSEPPKSQRAPAKNTRGEIDPAALVICDDPLPAGRASPGAKYVSGVLRDEAGPGDQVQARGGCAGRPCDAQVDHEEQAALHLPVADAASLGWHGADLAAGRPEGCGAEAQEGGWVKPVTIGHATLYHGDALAMLQQLAEGEIHALITDPPYSSGGAFRGDRAQDTKTKYLQTDSGNHGKTQDFGGDNRDQRAFHFWSCLWAAAALRACEPGAPALIFTDWRQLPVSTDYLQGGGWVWRGVVPWAKKSARPQMGRFSAQCEYVVWGSAGPMPLERDVGCLPGFYEFSSPQDRVHITQKPVELMEAMVQICRPGGGSSRSVHGQRNDGRGSSTHWSTVHWLRAECRVFRSVVRANQRGSDPSRPDRSRSAGTGTAGD